MGSFHDSKCLFPDRNLDTSQPSGTRDPAPPLLRLAQARLSFGSCLLRSAQVCSPILLDIVNF
jgi:hypothetical protein